MIRRTPRSTRTATRCLYTTLFRSPEAVAYISAPTSYQSFTSQQSVGGSVAGTLVDLPAGPLGMAFGLEYRDEYSRSEFDALQQAESKDRKSTRLNSSH